MIDFAEHVKKGIPFSDVLIIDAHSHLGRHYKVNIPPFTVEKTLEVMDALGIDAACVSHHAAIATDYVWGNDLILDAVRKYPGRFLGYCTVNPHYPEDIRSEIDRCFEEKGIIGIKIHPSEHQVPIDYKVYNTVYEIAAEKHCPVLIHVWGQGAVAELDRVAGRYPDTILIMGHAGADVKAMSDAIEVVNKRKNVYADLALSYVREENVEWLVKEMGSRKVLYASDMTLFDPSPAVGRVAMADISEEEKRNVFGLNMQRILGLEKR